MSDFRAPAIAPASGTVPVFRPRLPVADRVLPYLRRIDESRQYSNRGPLVLELEARLAGAFRGTPVVSAASGTAALVAAIIASAGRATRELDLAILPAYTFVATAMAVEQCGYRPYFVDVDPRTWALDAERLTTHPALARAGIVVPVAPYGMALDVERWVAFRARTGIAVAIDAAASFERFYDADDIDGRVPVALSFHATKSYSTVEGGAVVWRDVAGLGDVAASLNFGFHGQRRSDVAGTNGKLSEYHAAMGLASLDVWPQKSAAFGLVSATYLEIAARNGVRIAAWPKIASNYALFEASSPSEAHGVVARLAERGIETRHWYGTGVHAEPHFRNAQRDDVSVAEDLAARLVGLPMYDELERDEIEIILATIAARE